MTTKTTDCTRCGRGGLVNAPPANAEARLLRRKAAGRGLCAECAVTQFLKTTEPTATLLGRPDFADVLAAPHVRAQFTALLRAAGSDVPGQDIDWRRVAENWSLA